MNPRVNKLLNSVHCPKHGMEWEACCYSEVVLDLHNKIDDLLTTIREEARRAAFKDAADAVRAKAKYLGQSDRQVAAQQVNGCLRAIDAIETIAALEAAKEGKRDG